MSNHLPYARQTFQISLDIETTLYLPSQEPSDEKVEHYYSALIQTLLAHPETLSQLFRLAALATLPTAWEILTAEYSKGVISEQELLTPMIEQLEPDAQAYFTEEIEDEQKVFLFDGYSATIKHVQMTASDVA
jgi:hypothetical protein